MLHPQWQPYTLNVSQSKSYITWHRNPCKLSAVSPSASGLIGIVTKTVCISVGRTLHFCLHLMMNPDPLKHDREHQPTVSSFSLQ